MIKNSLKIQASTLKLDFEGSAQDIRQGYAMTQELIISCFQEQLIAPASATGTSADAATTIVSAQQLERARDASREQLAPVAELKKRKDQTQSLHRVDLEGIDKPSWKPPATRDEQSYVGVALSSDLYHKVCVLERDEFEASTFAKALRFEGLGRIYIQNEQRGLFKRYFTLGKVLWRELTTQGRAAVRHESRAK